MPQRIRRLRETLDTLRAELEASRELDPGTQDQIREAVEEIEAALVEAEAGPPSLSDALPDRFRQALQRFEGSYPKLTAAVGRVVDALADLGI